MSINNGYKLIAIASLSYALFSCSASVQSHTDPELLAKLEGLETQIAALSTNLGQVQTAVRAVPAGSQACTVQEVIDGNISGCDATLIPDGVSTSTSYCIQQSRGGELGGVYKLEPELTIELGGGWPNAIWGKATGEVKTPAPTSFGVPLPNEVSASGKVGIGRGLSICASIPVTALDAAQVAQIHDLVRGVNEPGGKYPRRTGRVLNYAAVRTPQAAINLKTASPSMKASVEGGEDSFDIADEAIERVISGDFLQPASGALLFSDGAFQDLVSALDVPAPVADTIADPDRIFSILNTIGQSNIANTCDIMGITPANRARYPALANQCARFGIYPNINASLNSAAFVGQVRNRVNSIYTASGLRDFMCSNIALAVFSPQC